MIKFFGGIWSFSGRGRDVVLKVLFGGIDIAFGCATVLSVWNRDLRRTDCRCGISELGESYCGLESEGLRMSENHLWTAEAGDGSEVAVSNSSELLRLCFADFNRISSLTPSMGLCLLADLESGSRRSKAEADTLARAATNLGDPMSLEGESHRAGEEATIRLASSSHS